MLKDEGKPMRQMLEAERPSFVRRFHITYVERDDTAPIPRLTAALQAIAALECLVESDCACPIHVARGALAAEVQAAEKMVQKDLKFYISPGMYPDGKLGELFIKGDQPGSLLAGVMDTVATMISLALQYGVPLQALTSKLRGNRFGPAMERMPHDPDFRKCTSMFDLVAQYLDMAFPDGKFMPKEQRDANVSGQGEVPQHEGALSDK